MDTSTPTGSDTPSTGLKYAMRERARDVYRAAILDASEQVLLQKSLQTAKVSDIAEAAGISVGTVYNYFNSKEAVFAALVARQRKRVLDALGELYSSTEPLEQLQEFIRRTIGAIEQTPLAYVEFARQRFDDQRDVSVASRAHGLEDEGIQEYVVLLERHLRRAIDAKRIRQDCSTDDLSWYLLLLLRTAYQQWEAEGRKRSLSDRCDLLVHLFLLGATGTAPLRGE